ncbi:hypothetical protein R6Q59_017973 [Mikania micrantha]
MDIRKRNLFYQIFVNFFLLICHHHQATEIEQQINGTPNLCKDILGTLWKNDSDKQLHESISTFNVCVPKNTAFHEFVDVNEHDELKGGFSITIFCLVLQELPFKIQPLFKPVDEQGNYTHIIMKLGQDCDAVVGDTTITSNRTKYAEFTIPYMSSEIYMLVPAERKWNQTMLTLLKPFTLRLWLLILTVWMLTGATIGYLEYRSENPDFYHAPLHKSLFMIIWFPLSKFFFQEGEIRNRCSKFVFVVWLVTIFIVMQIFTACLSSWLTINQLQPKVLPKEHQVVGYQNGSFIVDFVNDHAQRSGITTNPIALSSLDDYKNVLDNGTVDAIYDELPYIEIFLAKYGDAYMKVGPIATEPGLGFAFTRGFTLLQDFSQAVIKVIEYPDMTSMTETYLGIQTRLGTLSVDVSFPQSLSPMSFSLLFAFASLSIVAAILVSEITRMCTRNNSNKSSEMMSIISGNGTTHAEC